MSRIVFRDATILDGTGADPVAGRDVIVEEGRIAAVRPSGEPVSAETTIDAVGTTLMPGLIDAHVHFALVQPGASMPGGQSYIEHVLAVRGQIEQALHEGFTTVRDAGGLEPAWARVVASGKIAGPRILPSGAFISQTGGHADSRAAHEAVHRFPSIPGLVANPEIVDGPDAVRRAAREQLRRGATQIKLMVSGGVMSPTDPLESIQFTVEEIAAAVDAARSWGTYVLAHAHTIPGMRNAVAAGVRSIEHASLLDEETAAAIHQSGAFIVPTLLVSDPPAEFGHPIPELPPEQAAKQALVATRAAQAVRLAHATGIPLGSGSDLVGPDQAGRAWEIVMKARAIGAMQALVSTTLVNARLLRLDHRIRHDRAGQGRGPRPGRRGPAGRHRGDRRAGRGPAGHAARRHRPG